MYRFLVPALFLFVCAAGAKAQTYYSPADYPMDGEEYCDPTDYLQQVYHPEMCSCRPHQPAGVIPVISDPRPYAPGQSFRRPDYFIDYPSCGDGVYHRMGIQSRNYGGPMPKPATQPAARAKPHVQEPAPVIWDEDAVTQVTANMVLPVHPNNPAAKGQVIIRPFVAKRGTDRQISGNVE
jgi:hypothetical protein